tara:strand:+ start:590 stop:2092 length:1503 start_codon:yes stop_codon:yes gene_type:complete
MGFSTSTPAVLTYLPATNLYVNSGSGNDSGDGTISDPLQSLEEALKNVYARRVNGINTSMALFLSGNSGDADVHDVITYYWPGKYFALMGQLDIWGWDGTSTSTTAPTPSTLYTGSAVLYSNDSTVDMDHWGGGIKTALFTDSGYSTPMDFGTPGSMGVLSDGWHWQRIADADSVWSGYRAVAHTVTGTANNNVVRTTQSRTNGDFTPLTTDSVGDMAIIKWGTMIDYTEYESSVNNSLLSPATYKQEFWNLAITSSTTNLRAGIGWTAGRVSMVNVTLKHEAVAQHGGYWYLNNCYYAPSDQGAPSNFGGILDFFGSVLDLGKTHESSRRFLRWAGETKTRGYCVLQNLSGSTDNKFGPVAKFINVADINGCIWHLTNSSGFYGGIATDGGSIHTTGVPIKLIGELNNTEEGGTYSLRLPSGSMWLYHTGSMVMQEGGTTEALVSVSNGEAQGSADLFAASYIVNYTSSIDRAGGAAANYPTYATDYSSSLAALEAEAD